MSSLKEKYGDKFQDYYTGVRKDILPVIPKHSARVLEIGCGQGNTLAYLKDNGYCDWACGVDLFPDAIEVAKTRLDEVYQGNIEEMNLPIKVGSIDMILCLDVLEHLIDPQKAVAYLHTLLAPEGIIVASIPNVRHFSASLPLLLQNKWEYKERGILDNTHIRFFVRDSAVALMQSSGLTLDCVTTNMGSKSSALNRSTLRIFESFLSMQYLIRVSRQH